MDHSHHMSTEFDKSGIELNKTDRNLLLQKFEELQQQHQQSLRSTSVGQSNNSSEDFEDIQFFHRLPQLQPIKMNINGGDVVRGALYDFNNTSENPFVFPDNVMEYGEPQFFPGNCVGYLETILEETDEEYEEEEGCSGRHWWTADSDTDTDSVIRVDRATSNNVNEVSQCQIPTSSIDALHNNPDALGNNSKNLHGCIPFPVTPFRMTASSKPFEMEDLYLFDQLDLAFEETLTKPRGRTGFAFGDENQQQILHPLEQMTETNSSPDEVVEDDIQVSLEEINNQEIKEMEEIGGNESPQHGDSSASSDDEQPAEVNEEDFFYSTSEENSSLTDTTTSESDDTSSDEGGNKDGVVLAEFSLTAGFNSGLFKSHRRSFEGTPSKSKLRSFRSFDSLNSLAGTELLFSKAETFPSFHEFIKDTSDPPLSVPVGDDIDHDQNIDINNKIDVTRKSSGEMSSENLSEDSGICDGAGSGGSGGILDAQIDRAPHTTNFIAKSAFALNPLLYSSPSASEENSMISYGSNHSFEPSNHHLNSDISNNSPRSSPDSNSYNRLEHTDILAETNIEGSIPSPPPHNFEFRSTNINGTSMYVQEFLSNANNHHLTQVSTVSGLHPSSSNSSSYLEQTFVDCDKNVQTPAKTKQHNLSEQAKEESHHQLRPILTAFRRNLETHQNDMNYDLFFREKTRAAVETAGVGGSGYNIHDEDEDEDLSNAMFTMLELQASRGYEDDEDDDGIDGKPSNNIINICKLNNVLSRADSSLIPELIEVTSSDMTNNSPGAIMNSGLGEVMNANNTNVYTNIESESKILKQCLLNAHGDGIYYNTDEEAETNRDRMGVVGDGCVMRSGPMSTLKDSPSKYIQVQHSISPLPTTTTSPSISVSMSSTPQHIISYSSTSEWNGNTVINNNPSITTNTSMDMDSMNDMDYFQSLLESEILTEPETLKKYQAPVPVYSQNQKEHVRSVRTKKSITPTTHPILVSVELEKPKLEHLHLFDPSSSSAPATGTVASATATTGEFLPSISGLSNFGKVGNLRDVDDVDCSDEEGLGGVGAAAEPVSEPLVVRRRTWNCAGVDEQGESHEEKKDLDKSQVPAAFTTSANVPDILKIQKHTNTQDMEIVERPRSISPRNPIGGISSTSSSRGSESPNSIPIKTYGSHGEVEVYLVSSRTPSPISPTLKIPGGLSSTSSSSDPCTILTNNTVTTAVGAGTVIDSGSLKINKTVHFSPVVSEISWRESYTDQGSEFSESSTDNHLDHYHYEHDNEEDEEDEDEDDDTDTINEDELMMANKSEVIERVHIQSQVIQEPVMSSTNQNQIDIHPAFDNDLNPSKPLLSMVPDLLSQCENINNLPKEKHIEVKIENKHITNNPSDLEKSETKQDFIQIQPQQQQQIFPSMFADTKDSKGSKSKKSSTITSKKGFLIGKSKDKDKGTVKNIVNNEDINQKPEKEKPSFFQRLSKIRLSGSSGNKSKNTKVKIHPKEKENEEPPPSFKDEVDKKTPLITSTPVIITSTTSAPIPKKQINNSPNVNGTDAPTIFYNKNGHINSQIHEGEECSAAFESILEEIAGLNTIRQRQQTRSAADNKRTFAERNQFLSNPEIDRSKDRDSDILETKLSQFKADASKTRDEIAKSHPDFETIEDVTRIKTTKGIATSSPNLSASGDDSRSPNSSIPKKSFNNQNEEQQAGSERKREREWYKLLKSAAEKYYYGGKVSRVPLGTTTTTVSGIGFEIDNDMNQPTKNGDIGLRSTGIVETDLDTGASREMLDAELIDLEREKGVPPLRPPLPKSPTTGNGKARSLTNLTSNGGGGLKFSLPPDPSSPLLHHHHQSGSSGVVDIDTLANEVEERAKSFEFLLDETQKSSSVPPENQLRNEARQLSEHELRIQRSLQKLNVPDWYRKHGYDNNMVDTHNQQDRSSDPVGTTATTTTLALKLLKRADYGSANGLAGGWAGLSTYRTPSLSSLQNSGRYTGSLTRSNFVRGRPATMSATRSSRESLLLSPSSTASQSPNAFERCSFTYGMPYSISRFGQGRLSSTSGASPVNSSPPSTPGPLSAAYTRKPYLGWRSQERLNNSALATTVPPKLSFYRPPAERLAAEVMTLRQRSAPLRPTGSDRPPLPRPPPRAEKTGLTKREYENETSVPPPPSVHDSIRQVTDAINQFVALGQEEPPRPTPRQRSGKKQAVWMESSFVGRKPRVTN